MHFQEAIFKHVALILRILWPQQTWFGLKKQSNIMVKVFMKCHSIFVWSNQVFSELEILDKVEFHKIFYFHMDTFFVNQPETQAIQWRFGEFWFLAIPKKCKQKLAVKWHSFCRSNMIFFFKLQKYSNLSKSENSQNMFFQ